MLARLSAFASWAVVAASLMYWLLRLFAAPATAPDYTVAVDQAQRGDLARIFGASAAPTPAPVAAALPASPASSRFKLVGVAAPIDAGDAFGLALISVDGKAPRAIRVGRTVDDGWLLQSVSRRTARLGSNVGAETLDLELPALALASRGVPGVVAPPVTPPGGAPSPARPAVIPVPAGLPQPGAGAPPGAAGAAQTPVSAPAPVVPGSPPTIFVPQEELDRARSRASTAPEE